MFLFVRWRQRKTEYVRTLGRMFLFVRWQIFSFLRTNGRNPSRGPDAKLQIKFASPKGLFGFHTVLLVPCAVGATELRDWLPGAALYNRIPDNI